MSETHVVKAGETLISIAHAKEFRTWQTIWEHEENASLREKRTDPQVLAEGDEVFIPDKEPREFSVDTNKKHSFVVKSLKANFRAEVRDDKARPLVNKQFELEIEGEGLETKRLSGFTKEGGIVELRISPKATSGELKVWMTDNKVLTWTLKLGSLDPIDTPKGVKARLTNLGFLCGELNDDEENDEYKRALKNFQLVHKLEMTGKADETTRKKLLYIHDKR